jgi:hypothetical protein
MKPFDYLSLVNAFAFPLPLYILLYTCVALITLLGIAVFWFINKLVSRCLVEFPPLLKVRESVRAAFLPAFTGTLLAAGPFVLCLWLVDILRSAPIFTVYSIYY